METHKRIEQNFKELLSKNGDDAYKNLKSFFAKQKDDFYQEKIKELTLQGYNQQDCMIKARQSWVSVIGRSLELVIEILIKDFCKAYNLKTTNDKALRSKKLNAELDSVKRALLVHFGKYSVLPDSDIIIYQADVITPKILAILSIKNSFRERYTETPYWKLKLMQSKLTKHIKVFMITPDNDDEISFNNNPKKACIVMEYELDGIYLAKNDFDGSSKIKSIELLLSDLRKLVYASK